ncbi:hypothetical protein D3C80_2039830 [compost metagenome]
MHGRMIIATSMITRPCMTVWLGAAAVDVETLKLEVPLLAPCGMERTEDAFGGIFDVEGCPISPQTL